MARRNRQVGKNSSTTTGKTPSAKHLYTMLYNPSDNVLSLPPIINGRKSLIQLHTRYVFVEWTGTNMTKVKTVLDIVVTMFCEYCCQPFAVEGVDIKYADCSGSAGGGMVTPHLSRRTCDATMADNRHSGHASRCLRALQSHGAQAP
ncbi:unnamed protein product [Sphagnum jensenii]|uniref:Uncharacterized protein n=2 Tax=Sphagnum jensenii TaxID=128206 RepID=A0ABP1A1G9_9BRYO